MSSIAMRRFTSGPSVCLFSFCTHGVLTFRAVIEGIEEPDKNFLFYSTCRCVIRKIPSSLILADPCIARIITHAPLRAKEASPFVSNKYPVVVCTM